MPSVVIVDDHPIVRAGMCAVLNRANDIRVVAEGATGADALRLVAAHRPDVLVLDVNLPDVNGIQVTRQLRAHGASPAILILTVHQDRQTVFGLLEAGATGYILKDDALETLVGAVRAVARGESWLSPEIARQVVARATRPEDRAPADALPLTPREIEILCLLAQGCANALIAQKLVITTRTVQNAVSTIYAKLGVSSRTQAALIAIRHGLVQVEPTGENADAP
ncbi:MAG: response regulator transcription factor [Chloroflexi bacterium]|nr:response regulator transcription factor [Chloroflexota bacterium]